MKFHLTLLFIATGTCTSVLADHYCSLSKTNVKCELYSSVSKNGTPCYRCPDGCSSPCQEVCNDLCLEESCHYITGSLQCSMGCYDRLAGKFCQEYCPEECERCHQFTSTCCQEDFGGPYCNKSLTIKSTTASSGGFSSNEYHTVTPKSTNRRVMTDSSTNMLKTTIMELKYGSSETTTDVKSNTTASTEEPRESGVSVGLIIMIVGVVGLVTLLSLLGYKFASHYREVKRAKEKKTTYHKYDSIEKQLDTTASTA